MSVVQKIAETHDFTIQFFDGDCRCYCYKQDVGGTELTGVGHGGFDPHIKSVYLSVLAFIKNQEKRLEGEDEKKVKKSCNPRAYPRYDSFNCAIVRRDFTNPPIKNETEHESTDLS